MDAADIRILSVGTALPGPLLDNAALARRFGMDELWQQWIDTFIGSSTRHLAVDLESGEVVSSLVDLGTAAARRALDNAGLEPGDIDVMVLGTAMPDQLMPTSVNMIADRLGINNVPTFQLQSGCTGAVQAMDLGRQLLLNGGRHALVIGGEVCAKHYDLTLDVKKMAPDELVNLLLFGDAAGAAVLTSDDVPDTLSLRLLLNRLTGLGRPPGQSVDWFGLIDRASARQAVSEDYKAIEESVPVMSSEILDEMLADLEWSRTDVDYLLPPQLSVKMTDRIVERLNVPGAEEISCVSEISNTGNALPFFQLERLIPQMAEGDRAIGIAVESSKWIKAGFALEKV
ncbi:3-oxoacyl-ACP synthase III family protein [Streptomyces kanamyceticus]|uniref:3-oxoacyl-ACP synthase n=1 Tax=Streptomyces kanamyceticus TaxID=1967 RepID=A0A5J6GKN5_STRKN|nr:3-oxoacyl-ACP synthase III family protein [Streptomyces kanamyceticus]QEU95747.1 3-oxoacyl-ACP synthase [Streptomyces kanamyceticus]